MNVKDDIELDMTQRQTMKNDTMLKLNHERRVVQRNRWSGQTIVLSLVLLVLSHTNAVIGAQQATTEVTMVGSSVPATTVGMTDSAMERELLHHKKGKC